MYTQLSEDTIRRDSDGTSIPATVDNSDYVAFLAWVAAGNTPAVVEGLSEAVS